MDLRPGNPVKSTVGNEHTRNGDTGFILVVFQYCGKDSRQGQSAPIERMHELSLTVLSLEAAFQAVALKGFEVGSGTDFQPTLLRSTVHFKVVGKCRGESHITST